MCRLQSWSGAGSADGDPLALAAPRQRVLRCRVQCEGPWVTLRQARGAGLQKLQARQLEFLLFSTSHKVLFFAFSYHLKMEELF